MKDEERGKIRNREWASQLRDYSGLRFGKITPTDIDGFLDFGNKIFVLIESKYGGFDLPYGQKLALERLCDSCQESGKETLLLIAAHNDAGDINVSDLLVREYRFREKWRNPKSPISVRNAIERFLKQNGAEDYYS